MTAYHAIADALAAQAKRDLAAKRAEDRARPIGQKRIDVDFYSEAERERPFAYDFEMGGKRFKGRAAFWCVVLVKWTGDRWQRYRRISGPMDYTEALDRMGQECRRRKMLRTHE